MKILHFSNYTWQIKSSDILIGPGPNLFSDDERSIYVDSTGLHLKTRMMHNTYYSCEVMLDQALGFGTYSFEIEGSLTTLDTACVFGAFLYEDDTHEIDIEFSKSLVGKNKGQYVIQPWKKKGNIVKFEMPNVSKSFHTITWLPESVEYASWTNEENSEHTKISHFTYKGTVIPTPAKANMIFNLWFYKGAMPEKEDEVIVKKFTYIPL